MIDFGISRSGFQDEYYERKPYLRRNCFDPSPFGWSTIDSALDMQDPTRELLKVLHNGRVEPSEYVEEYVDVGIRRRRIRKERLYSMVAAGATIVINRIELVSPQVRQVCMDVGKFIGAQTTSNAYACMGEDAATNPHWDTHDVFVIQIGGRKHWRIYEPTFPLPISSQISNDRKQDLPETPALDEILNAGDILYVPRGWWHRVVPVKDSDTLHLTIAVHTPLILDYFVWASASVLPQFLEMRYSLLGQDHDPSRVDAALAILTEALRDPQTLQAFYSRSQQRERVVSPFNLSSLLDRTDTSIPPETRLMLNTRHSEKATGRLLVNGTELRLPPFEQRIVLSLSNAHSMSLRELAEALPDIDRDRLQIAARELAVNDILHFIPPGEGQDLGNFVVAEAIA